MAGLRVNALLGGCSAVVQVLYGIVTARLVTPEQFGSYAVALSLLQLVSYLANVGLGSAVLRAERGSTDMNAAVGLALLCSAAGAGVMVVLAAPWSAFLHSPESEGTVQLLALAAALLGPATVSVALVRREWRFLAAGAIETTSLLLGFLTSVTALLIGAGPWALALAPVVANAVSTVLGAVVRRGLPVPRFITRRVLPLFRFSANVAVQNGVHYAVNVSGQWAVSGLVGQAETGFVSRAMTLVNLPLTQLSQSLSKTLYPMYGEIADKPERVRAALSDLLVATSLAAGVLFGLLAGACGPAILVLFGGAWLPVVAYLRILCVVGLLQALYSPVASFFEWSKWFRDVWRCQALAVTVAAVGYAYLAVQWRQPLLLLCVLIPVNLAAHALQLRILAGRGLVDLRFVLRSYVVHALLGLAVAAILGAADMLLEDRSLLTRVLGDGAVAVTITASLWGTRTLWPGWKVLVRRRAGRSDAEGTVLVP